MSNKQFLSILGMYNYDESVFDNLVFPEGVDKELLINNILLDNAELSLVYSDLDFMKTIIGVWSSSELDIWNKLYKTFNEEYNPLWNVDENTTETRDIDRTDNVLNKDAGSNINSVKAFNSDAWSEHDKVDTSGNSETNSDGTIHEVFTRRRGGNIGVTMSQQLLEAELNVRPKLNIYKYISNSFKNRFCNMIY